MITKESPIIAVACLSNPEPEIRELQVDVNNKSERNIIFVGTVWHFTVIEALKAEQEIMKTAPVISQENDIEVIDAMLTSLYYQSGHSIPIRATFSSNITDYARNPSELSNKDVILFLENPLNPKFYKKDLFYKEFGQAYPLIADPGMEDPSQKQAILEYLR